MELNITENTKTACVEAVVVAFNYLDILSITLPRNLEVLDHVIIVTKPGDPIIDFCSNLEKNIEKITVVQTDIMNYQGAKFNKGLCISLGMQYSRYFQWLETLDADIIHLPDWKEKFLAINPNLEYCWGSRRIKIENLKDLEDLESGKRLIESYDCWRGYIYGYHTVVNYRSSTFQRLLKERNGWPYENNFREARDLDWIWIRNWNNAQMIYNNPPNEPPNMYLDKNNDTTIGWAGEIPCRVLHLGQPGLDHEGRVTEKFT